MKKALVIILAISGALGVTAFLTSLEEPAEGVVAVEEVQVIVNEVVAEQEEEVEAPAEEPKEEVVEEPVEEVFNPIAVTLKDFKNKRKVKSFAKRSGGTVVNVGGLAAVKVGKDYYYKKDGKLFVRHNGEEIQL